MGLLLCILVGIFVGWLVAALQKVDEGMLSRMGMGAIGGFIGAIVIGMFAEDGSMMVGIDLPTIAASISGALLVLGIFSRMHGYTLRTGRRQPSLDK